MPTSVGRIMQRDESRQPAEAAGNEADEADKFEREEAEQQSRSHAREAERRAREQRQRTRLLRFSVAADEDTSSVSAPLGCCHRTWPSTTLPSVVHSLLAPLLRAAPLICDNDGQSRAAKQS